jgi:hypothetical protein
MNFKGRLMSNQAIALTTRHWMSGLLLCGAMALNSGAQAQFFDGEELLRVCSADENSAVFSPGVCNGYIMGVIDTAEGLVSAGDRKTSTFCVPLDESMPKLVDLVIVYLRANPARHDDWAGLLVVDALAESYPCKR